AARSSISVQLRKLAEISEKYDKGFGHFTTRQNLQLNWPELEQVPDILDELASVQMHAIQTSGNCIRNVTTDHLAGVAQDEIEDPRPYCEIIRQWSTLHPEFAFLPRKFKIAVNGAEQDRAAIQVHDIGLQIVKNENGEVGFSVLVGGGLGRTPILGKQIRGFLPKEDLLTYLEAILRIYNLHGRRDNKYKARIKILVKEMGIDTFRDLVEQEWNRIKDSSLKLTAEEIQRMQSYFVSRTLDDSAINDEQFQRQYRSNSEFAIWVDKNLVEHKNPSYKIVYLSLKAPDVPPGDVTSEQMRQIAELADQFNGGHIRSTHRQDLVFSDVKLSDCFELWQALKEINLATPNIGQVTDMICCPGLDYCALANATSIPIAKEINLLFDSIDDVHDLNNLTINISGCMNACGHHDVGHIGILGVDKKGEEWYQITLGGSASNDASLGTRLGPSFHRRDVVNAIDSILNVYVEERLAEEPFLDTFRRIGLEPFKKRAYEVNQAA
ncbi:MAG TPA: sulfite reductase, partial [Gammaproteobacteria bacterium]|nr:sulfite reductase [Gammaproteobacteria bacterium]